MTSSDSVVDTLEQLIEKGTFAARPTGDPARRSRFLPQEAGQIERAEQTLQAQRDVFASCLEPIACSLVALEKSKPGTVVDITERRAVTSSEIVSGPRHKFVVFSQALEVKSVGLPGQKNWGPQGILRPLAVVLEVGYANNDSPQVELGLFLPVWWVDHDPSTPSECAIIRFNSAGACRPTQYGPYIPPEEALKLLKIKKEDVQFPDSNQLVDHLLGRVRLQVWMVREISPVDRCISFPGAEAYLALQLPGLGEFYTALAGQYAALTKK